MFTHNFSHRDVFILHSLKSATKICQETAEHMGISQRGGGSGSAKLGNVVIFNGHRLLLLYHRCFRTSPIDGREFVFMSLKFS